MIFKKLNLTIKELDDIREENFKKFEIKGFPSKKQEHWKYSDLRNIIVNNFSDLGISNDNIKAKNKQITRNVIIIFVEKFKNFNIQLS